MKTSVVALEVSGQHVLVQIERWNAPLPEIKVSAPPPIEMRAGI